MRVRPPRLTLPYTLLPYPAPVRSGSKMLHGPRRAPRDPHETERNPIRCPPACRETLREKCSTMLHGTRRASAAPPRNGTKPHPIPAGAPCDTSRKVFHHVARDAPRVGGTPTTRHETPPDPSRPAGRHLALGRPSVRERVVHNE